MLAVSGGTDAPAMYGGSSGGLFLISFPGGKIRYIWFEGRAKAPIAWMPDGRLAYLRLIPGPDNEMDVEVMVTDNAGRNPKLWFRLPRVSGVDFSNEKLASADCIRALSDDGRLVAYVHEKVIYIDKVGISYSH